MDGDVGGVHGDDGVQGMAEAVEIVGGMTRDQIHVDGAVASLNCLVVGDLHIRCIVPPSAGAEDGIDHGLGVDAHAVSAAPGDDV